MNEALLLIALAVEFSAVVLAYRLFGKTGLYVMTAVCAVTANIEVVMLIDAFGLEQTLGNTLFAASFLVTDILSENEGKKAAQKAVYIGIFVSAFFLLLSQSWLLYQPSPNDAVAASMQAVFSSTPRILLSSLAVYAAVQWFDVVLYHRLWRWTERRFGNRRRFLWLRNNAATLLSQLINTVLFNLLAFGGTYSFSTMVSIIAAGYVIFIVTSLLDTPFLYWARHIKEKQQKEA